MQSTNQKIKNAILNSFLDKNTFEQNDEYAAKLIANTKDETMYNRILDEVQHCKSFTFAVAFIESGILNSLKTVLKDLNVQGRILTSTYLYSSIHSGDNLLAPFHCSSISEAMSSVSFPLL